MRQLFSIVERATPSADTHIRGRAYGREGIRDFLIDVMALANADVEGPRHIVIGVELDGAGRRSVAGVDEGDFSGKPPYQRLAMECIEPPVKLQYHRISVGKKQVGVFEIADCQDRPYMMRVDQSETLRRGDAYQRVNNVAVKMGRSKLQALFEENFRDSVSAAQIEIGFPGEIIFKDLRLPTHDLSVLPSAVAAARQRQMLEFKQKQQEKGAQTLVSRLNYARIFGSDAPYVDQGIDTLVEQLEEVSRGFVDEDRHFLFHENASLLQIVAFNQGEEELRNVTLSIVLPNHSALYVADSLPPLKHDGKFINRPAEERGRYPTVVDSRNAIKISSKVGDIRPGEIAELFQSPVRLCAGDSLGGRKLGILYTLTASNLREPASGKLYLRLEALRKAS